MPTTRPTSTYDLRKANALRNVWALQTAFWLLCSFSNLAFPQTQMPNPDVAQVDNAGTPVFRVQSRLVVVRVMVINKKIWFFGPSVAGRKCAFAAEQTFFRLAATEPYLPPDCDVLLVRGLSAKDFHLMVDGEEQKIESVTSESEGLNVRDNHGWHRDFFVNPASKWSTMDAHVPHYTYTSGVDYGELFRNRYDISFVPHNSTGCHKIEVKVNRRNTIVAARDEYCFAESPSDILNGSTFGKQLEQNLGSGQQGEIPLAMQTAVFEGNEGISRVRIALEFPMGSLFRSWSQAWFEQATIGVLGMIYKQDGTLAFRFSDFACCTPSSGGVVFGNQGMSLDQDTAVEEWAGRPAKVVSAELAGLERGTLPARYETQVDLPQGDYDLRIVLSDGKKFGRAEAHLKIEADDGKKLALSSVMLCNRFRDAHVAEVETKAANFAPQFVPMVSKGIQVTPAGDTTFSSSENLIAYFEIYLPGSQRDVVVAGIHQQHPLPGPPPQLQVRHPPQHAAGPQSGIQAHMRIVDAKSGRVARDFLAFDVASYQETGKSAIAVARDVPLDHLATGEYRLEVQAAHAAGHETAWKSAEFSINPKSASPMN